MLHNLTDKQLEALRWIVQHIKDGILNETFEVAYVQWSDGDRLFFPELRGKGGVNPDPINIGVLDALVASGILIPARLSRDTTRYTLTRAAYEITVFDFSNPEPDPLRSYIKETHHLVQRHFNPDELRQVCFELGVNDWVFGSNPDRPFELLLYLYRQNRLNELTPILQEQRPGVTWPDFPAAG